MLTRERRIIVCCLILSAVASITVISQANPPAIDDIQITVSTNVCDGSSPPPQSFVVYAKNKNTAHPIDATFQYDSNPSAQSFTLYDNTFTSYTDRYPKSLVIRVASGATVPIGCTINYRPSSAPKSFTTVPVVISVTGAAYVNPSGPNPPPEDARAFTAFFLQGGFSACPAGTRPAGAFYLVNLHPYARLRTIIASLGNGDLGQGYGSARCRTGGL